MTTEQAGLFRWGPYVQVAALCEYVLREADGVLSLIRVIDSLTHTERGANPPSDMLEFHFPLQLVVSIKAGTARGRHELTITPQRPSGETMPPLTATIQLEGENRGANLITGLDIPYDQEGVYWFNIAFDGHLMTRIPLDVRYSRLVTGVQPGAPP